MYLPTHIATGYLFAAVPAVARRRPPSMLTAVIPALIGSVTPDAIDKPLRAMEITAYSRTVGHSLFFVAALLVIWWLLDRRRVRLAKPFGWWIVGICSHLFADFTNDIFRGLEERAHLFTSWPGWPITTPDTFAISFSLGREWRVHETYTSLEIGVFALTAVVLIVHIWLAIRRS